MHLLFAALFSSASAVPHDLIGGGDPVEDDPEALEAMLAGRELPAAPVRWRLDPEASRLYAAVEPDARTLDNPRSHRHAVRATGWEGQLVLAEGARCEGEVRIPVRGLRVDEPEDRAALGIEGELNKWDKAEVLEHMLHAEQLDVISFPEIAFKVDECAALPAEAADGADPADAPPAGWSVKGRLTLHGVTQQLAIDLRGSAEGDALSLTGSTHIRQTSFGIEPYFALFGQRRNRDAVKLTLRLEGSPMEEGESDEFAPIQQGPEVESVFGR
jgi:polyisoprenoid-binding protein YceI